MIAITLALVIAASENAALAVPMGSSANMVSEANLPRTEKLVDACERTRSALFAKVDGSIFGEFLGAPVYEGCLYVLDNPKGGDAVKMLEECSAIANMLIVRLKTNHVKGDALCRHITDDLRNSEVPRAIQLPQPKQVADIASTSKVRLQPVAPHAIQLAQPKQLADAAPTSKVSLQPLESDPVPSSISARSGPEITSQFVQPFALPPAQATVLVAGSEQSSTAPPVFHQTKNADSATKQEAHMQSITEAPSMHAVPVVHATPVGHLVSADTSLPGSPTHNPQHPLSFAPISKLIPTNPPQHTESELVPRSTQLANVVPASEPQTIPHLAAGQSPGQVSVPEAPVATTSIATPVASVPLPPTTYILDSPATQAPVATTSVATQAASVPLPPPMSILDPPATEAPVATTSVATQAASVPVPPPTYILDPPATEAPAATTSVATQAASVPVPPPTSILDPPATEDAMKWWTDGAEVVQDAAEDKNPGEVWHALLRGSTSASTGF